MSKKHIEHFVVNLKRRPDRLSNFLNTCPIEEKINVIYGFDGKNIDEENIDEVKLMSKFPTFSPGEIGCFLSHLRIWRMIVKDNIKHSLIFEDDAIFSDDFLSKFNLVLGDLKDDMDILYIGGRFEPNFIMNSNYYLNISDNVIQHKNDDFDLNVNGYIFCRTTHSYIISYNLAKILIDIFDNESTANIALDHWIILNVFKNNIKIYDSLPLLCHSPFISDSDIR